MLPGPDRAVDDGFEVFLVDDHPMMLGMLRKLIDAQGDLSVVGVASSAEEALECLVGITPDVLLVDLSLPGMSGDGLIRRLRETRPNLRALIVSGHSSDLYAETARKAGACGYVMKDDTSEIVLAARVVARGETYQWR